MTIAARLDDIGKPAWIGLIIVSFILFWPAGLVVLGYLNDNHADRDGDFINRISFHKSTQKELKMADKTLTCSDCGKSFSFTQEEQEYFNQRGYSDPKRCKECRQAKKEERGGSSYGRKDRY